MPQLKEITLFLNETLKVSDISDTSINGLQVDSGNIEIKKIAFAVDSCIESFRKAKENNCDLIIVHHGIFWDPGVKSITGTSGRRIRFLLQNNLSLYASHLPLDVHPTLGNNAYLKDILSLTNVKRFAPYGSVLCGFYSKIKPLPIEQVAKKFESRLKSKVSILQFGPKICKKIGIVSGSGSFGIESCKELGIDTFFTGEMKHSSYHLAKENNINLLYGGHYATEKGGVQNLMPLLKNKFKVETVFIDSPTGL